MIKPLRDYVVLEKVPVEKKVGGIILTQTEDKDSDLALVIAVGPGYENEKGEKVNVEAKVGQKVLYKKYSTTDYEDKLNNKKYILIQDKDILAIVD